MKIVNKITAAALLLLLSGVVSTAGAQPAGEAKTKLEALAEGKPHLAKMTGNLLQMRKGVKAGARLASAAKNQSAAHAMRNGQLQVIIGVTELTDDLLDAIRGAKINIVKTYNKYNVKQVVVRTDDPRKLDAIAARADVRAILPEPLAMTFAGSALNQADLAMRAPTARTNFGVDGSGVRVGVLSDSFVSKRMGSGQVTNGFLTGSTDQVSGDLPASIRIIDNGPNNGSDEGNAMAQLIYDVAPGCDIAFASAFTSYLGFAEYITELRTDPDAPCDVIVDDVIYFVEPMYQDGPIALAASDAAANGVPYFSSAGNNAANGHEEVVTDADETSNSRLINPTGVDVHDFGVAKGLASDRHLTLTVPANSTGGATIVLKWDEPYDGGAAAGPGAEGDLDLYLVNDTAFPLSATNIVASSTSLQGVQGAPAGEPYEIIQVSNLATGNYHVVVDHYDGRGAMNMSVIVYPNGGLQIADSQLISDRTIFGHAAAEGATAVGAIYYREWEPNARIEGAQGWTVGEIDPPVNVINVESFSSKGGQALPIHFTANGTRLLIPEPRSKPEMTAPDGCDTTFFGGDADDNGKPNFFGTSAAAPNAAAVAALLLERSRNSGLSLTPEQVYTIMEESALDSKSNGTMNLPVETAGTDDLAGAGVIDADWALSHEEAPVGVSGFSVE